ncbi:MAG: outer membrane lipoprotein chaperone LolA [Gammaproteobacteria bacterium]|nr:outer membrane lipoprotein chaperone LolA [Gammaproteobacteria bacterium]MYD81644.1 outer membrane lipoprotein chaperone LolA [Gammaproteobacteria bacterium]
MKWATVRYFSQNPRFRRIVPFCVLLSLLSCGNSLANEELKNDLLEKLNAIDSFQADFHQRTTARDGTEEEMQEGRVAFLRPEKFLWVVDKPYEEQVSIVGTRMQVYDPDLQQLTHSQVDPNELSFANLLIDSDTKKLDEFEIYRNESRYVLSPENDDSQIALLSIVFKDETLERIELVDLFGTQIEFEFFNIRLNEDVENEVFKLVVPPDTEVIGTGESSHNSES